MSNQGGAEHLVWRTTEVEGRRVEYGVAGHGLPVVFIHGWALGSHAYKRALKRLVRMGCRVFAPALPGFGRSAGLSVPGARAELGDYAAWADGFLGAVGVSEPVLAIGHSFGGAVATKLAHDFPDRVGHLVLIDSVGAGVWSHSGGKERHLTDRPLWDWAVHFPIDLVATRGAVPAISAILEDALPNFFTNPMGLLRAAGLARRADLTSELAALPSQGIPVAVLWGEGDLIIPRASFEALCNALGADGHLVPGRHSWLLADPDSFARVMASIVGAASAARSAETRLARTALPAAQLPRAASL